MKPPPFTYHRPETVPEALALLAELGPDGKVLAGGQSLLPLLSMRLAAPAHLVDINRLPGLDQIDAGPEGVRIGALARHSAVLAHDGAAAVQPLLRQGLEKVAHPTIRNRGTSVGSLVHADPSAELPAILALTGGYLTVASAQGQRRVNAADFFLGPLESALAPGELAVDAFFPAVAPRTGTAFGEVSRRQGDYAVCGVAAAVTLGPDGDPVAAWAAYISVNPVPLVLDLSDAVRGGNWQAAAESLRGQLQPEDDLHATAEYRDHLARVLTVRALAEAASRAAAVSTHAATGARRTKGEHR